MLGKIDQKKSSGDLGFCDKLQLNEFSQYQQRSVEDLWLTAFQV